VNFVSRTSFDAASWMRQAIMVLALRLQHEAAITRTLRGQDRPESLLGLIVSDDEAEAILAEASGRLHVSGTAASAAELADMQKQLSQARLADPDGIWVRLASVFGLAEAELDLLLFAAAPAVDPRIGRVYGYLNDDLGKRYLTPTLALRLLDDLGVDQLTLRRMLAADSPLAQMRLVVPGPERPFAECPLRVDEALIDRLLGDTPRGTGHGVRIGVTPGPERGMASELLLAVAPTPLDPGPLALMTAAGLGLDPVVIEYARFAGLDRGMFAATLASTLRDICIDCGMPVLTGFDAASPAEKRDVAALALAPMIIITAKQQLWQEAGLSAKPVHITPLAEGERRDWMARLTDGLLDYGPQDRERLVRMRHLTLLAIASMTAIHTQPSALFSAAADTLRSSLTGLARVVQSGHRLADMVLQPNSDAALRSLVSSQLTLDTVLDVWGLGAVLGKRRSMTVLFKGPSGTGKSMAAGALANELGLPLFHVDLAGMVSKYIGETEKNLDRLFETAASADVVLFFDEADAIFGERTEIQDARDRYANLQTSYLLQRLESFDGISILATNLQKNIDEAFLRRIDLVVDFPAPGKADRLTLWRRIEQTKAPLAADIDFNLLAERMELTGAEIRNCWLDAAHQAADCGRPINMDMILNAVGRELVKQGKPVRKTAFGDAYTRLGIGEGSS
jgi:ATPase family associated with various cellular activities (AAA)